MGGGTAEARGEVRTAARGMQLRLQLAPGRDGLLGALGLVLGLRLVALTLGCHGFGRLDQLQPAQLQLACECVGGDARLWGGAGQLKAVAACLLEPRMCCEKAGSAGNARAGEEHPMNKSEWVREGGRDGGREEEHRR